MDSRPPVVFVSHAHDSPGHIEHVVRFATYLRSLGVDAHLDEWCGAVRHDRYAWLIDRLETADFVVVVASPAYRAAGDGLGPADRHRGVQTEAALLRERLHRDRPLWTERILPVVLPGGSVEDLPLFLTPYTTRHYEIPAMTLAGLTDLLRAVHGESAAARPSLVPLPPFTAADQVAPHAGLDRAADDLATAAAAALARAEDGAGERIELSWTGPDGTGTASAIAARYERAASRRLLILGGGGAGKTTVAAQLAVEILRARAGHRDVPVPVLLAVGDWHPRRQSLREWLVATLVRDYPHLGAAAGWSPTLAAGLVDTARVLPVLDGFDEIAPGLRVAALQEIADSALALVLTSRPAEYHAAAGQVDRHLDDRVTLDPLTPEAIAGHFAADPRWAPVLAASGPLMETLATPLMTALAAAVHAPGTGREPSELLVHPTRRALETHLLADYVPSRYAARSGRLLPGRDGSRWPVASAHRWLTLVAGDLAAREAHAFGWWELSRAVPARARALVSGLLPLLLAVAVVVPSAAWWGGRHPLVVTVIMWIPLGLARMAARLLPTWASYAAAPVAGFATAVVGGAAGGDHVWGYLAWFGLVFLAGVALSRPGPPAPAQTAWPLRHWWLGVRHRLGAAAVGGLAAAVFLALAQLHHTLPERTWVILAVAGAVCGFAVGAAGAMCAAAAAVASAGAFTVARLTDADAAAEVAAVWSFPVVAGVVVVVALGSAVRLVAGGFDRDVVLAEAADARSTRTADRSNAIVQGVAAVAGIVALSEGFAWVFVAGTPPQTGLSVGTAVFATVVLGTAWGQWVVFARIWLPLRGELPWRTAAFLEDAVNRGVLRRTGAVYRFRHGRLRDALAVD